MSSRLGMIMAMLVPAAALAHPGGAHEHLVSGVAYLIGGAVALAALTTGMAVMLKRLWAAFRSGFFLRRLADPQQHHKD